MALEGEKSGWASVSQQYVLCSIWLQRAQTTEQLVSMCFSLLRELPSFWQPQS